MVDASVKQQVEGCTPGSWVRVILRQEIAAPEAVNGVSLPKSQRYKLFIERYLAKKRPGIDLAREAELQVDDLPGTPDVIVSGTKEAMLRFLNGVADHGDVSVVPEHVFSAG
ncbi:MAG: hypothetical protein SFX74_13225 [Fimbriimonadaceae bacterium]|nr:hypothetical protein [Fimbriimonadaceae bacterium]